MPMVGHQAVSQQAVLAFSCGPVFFPRRPGESLADLLATLGGPALGTCASELEAALRGDMQGTFRVVFAEEPLVLRGCALPRPAGRIQARLQSAQAATGEAGWPEPAR
jgi:hypothetical protein